MMSVETNQKINLLAEEDLAQGTESRKKNQVCIQGVIVNACSDQYI